MTRRTPTALLLAASGAVWMARMSRVQEEGEPSDAYKARRPLPIPAWK